MWEGRESRMILDGYEANGIGDEDEDDDDEDEEETDDESEDAVSEISAWRSEGSEHLNLKFVKSL
jgi:hypothetical protein